MITYRNEIGCECNFDDNIDKDIIKERLKLMGDNWVLVEKNNLNKYDSYDLCLTCQKKTRITFKDTCSECGGCNWD